MSGLFGSKPCDGCATRDDMIALLKEQLQDREKAFLALVSSPAVLRARFPEPRTPAAAAPEAPPQSVVVTPDMRRGQVYTPPYRDSAEMERLFEMEDSVQ